MLKKNLIIGLTLAMVIFWCRSAMAEDEPIVLVQGMDFYVNNMYDYRTYHESHPKSSLPNNSGSQWIIGMSVHNDEAKLLIDKVKIIVDNTQDGMNYHVTIEDPASYPWGGQLFDDYSIWINNLTMVDGDSFQVVADAGEDNPILFDVGSETLQTALLLTPDLDEALPPVCEIKHMAIKKNGELKMRFTAPYDIRSEDYDRNVHIRVRIFNEEGTGLDVDGQFKIFPPFQIVKKNGTIVPDKVILDNIPAKFVGRTGRIEYRVNSDTGVMLRGITYFKLPELEE